MEPEPLANEKKTNWIEFLFLNKCTYLNKKIKTLINILKSEKGRKRDKERDRDTERERERERERRREKSWKIDMEKK